MRIEARIVCYVLGAGNLKTMVKVQMTDTYFLPLHDSTASLYIREKRENFTRHKDGKEPLSSIHFSLL